MSALGQKRTSRPARGMSALPPKADIGTQSWNVRFVPIADSCTAANSIIEGTRVCSEHDVCICSLLSSFAQRSFQGGVEIAPHLRHTLIAILAKEGRRLVVFKNALALLVLKQNYPKRHIESSAELIAGHLRSGEGIADFILERIASAGKNLQQRSMIALLEDR